MAVPAVFAVSVSPVSKVPGLIATVAPAKSWPLESAAVAPASTATAEPFWVKTASPPAVTVGVASKARLAGLLTPAPIDEASNRLLGGRGAAGRPTRGPPLP